MAATDFHADLSRVIAQLTAAVTNTGLYSPTHPQVAQYIQKAYAVLSELLQAKPEITVMIVGNDLIGDQRPLPSDSAYVMNFVRLLRKKAIERITFLAGLPLPELQAFILELASADAAAMHATPHLKIGKVEIRVNVGQVQAPSPEAADAPREAMEELLTLTATELDELKDLYIKIKRHKQLDVRSVDDVVKRFVAGFRKEINPLQLLASLKSSHEYTFTHVANVGILTMSQAELLGFSGEHLHQIGVASLLHDVGKLFIPEDILSKPSKLTMDERKIIETHTTKGARYLMGLDGIPKLAVLAAMEHHLKFDGTGYPSIKGGWMPNIASQIIAIADVFDAMRSRRTYQESQPMEKIEAVLRGGSGTSFNPQLVELFLRMIKK